LINTTFRQYNYFTIGTKDEYGQLAMPGKDATPDGKVTMAINLTSQVIQDNINYKDANYMGLTHAKVDDTYIIEFNGERLKVLYVNPFGRLNQVFMKQI
jgi:hypothetical protein